MPKSLDINSPWFIIQGESYHKGPDMPLIERHSAPTFQLPGTHFTGLAAPSRGSTETSVWLVELAAGTPAVPHCLTREEIFVCLEGQANARLGDEEFLVGPGSALVVPA